MSRTLLRDSTIYGIGTLATQSLGFLLIPVYTRFLAVSDYGALSLLNATLQIVSFITLLGVSSAAMRFWFEPQSGGEDQRAVYGNATVLLLVFPALVLLVLGPLVWFLNTRFVTSIAFFPLVAMVLAIGLFTPFIKLMTGFLRVRRKARAFVLFNLAFFLVQTLSIIGGVVWLDLGLRGQVAAQLATNALFAAIAVAVLLRVAKPRFSADLTRRMLAFGVPLVPFFIASWVNTSAGRFMLERFTDLGSVGILALAAQFAGVMQLAAVAFDNAMMPHFLARAGQPGGAAELGVVINRYLAFLGLMGLAIILLASPVIALVAAAPYQEAARWVAPLTLAAWLAVANQPVVWSLNHAQRTGLLSGIVAVSTVVLLALLWLTLGPLAAGIRGVATAMIAANLVLVASGWLLARRHLALEIRVARLAGIVATLLVCGAAIDALADPRPGPATAAAQLGLLVVAAALLAWLTGIRLPRRAG
jgi:O-antigen/teichoic acid export membrane protein